MRDSCDLLILLRFGFRYLLVLGQTTMDIRALILELKLQEISPAIIIPIMCMGRLVILQYVNSTFTATAKR